MKNRLKYIGILALLLLSSGIVNAQNTYNENLTGYGNVIWQGADYGDNLNKIWTIDLRQRTNPTKITYFQDTEQDYDFVTIWESNDGLNWSMIYQNSGFASGVIFAQSSSQYLQIQFTSDGSVSNDGGLGFSGVQIKFEADNALVTQSNLQVAADGVIWGKLGVGTAELTQKLNIGNGRLAIKAPGAAVSDEGYNGALMITKSAQGGQYINLVRQGVIPWSIGTVYNSSTFAIGISKSNESAFIAPYLSITAGGNVGIGTTTPQNALDVKGTIRAKEVLVTDANWADFVFDANYQLPSLESVEQHIKEKGHLPEIPSAAEVKENGVNVVDVQAKLLQKVEEMTLYIIQQQKEIEALRAEMKSFKK